MGRASEAIALVVIALVVIAVGVAVYRWSLRNYEAPLSKLEPVECGGHRYLADPQGLALVYDRRAAAYDVEGRLIVGAEAREIVYIAGANCTAGYFIVANKTIAPGSPGGPWNQYIVLIRQNPAAFMFMVPEDYARSLSRAAMIPTGVGMLHARESTTSRGNIVIPTFGGPAGYSVSDSVAYEQSMGLLAYRRLYLEITNESLAGLLVPHHIVGETVLSDVLVSTQNGSYYSVKRTVDSLILTGFSGGLLVAAGIIALLRYAAT